MPNGLGQPKLFPPLAGSEWLQVSDDTLIKMQLHGVTGPMLVDGKPYRNVMPANAATMTDEQVAEALTFVVQKWGADSKREISTTAVADTRAKYKGRKDMWTVKTIGEVPESAQPKAKTRQTTGQSSSGNSDPSDSGGATNIIMIAVIVLIMIVIGVATLRGNK